MADQFSATRRALEEAVIPLVHSIDSRIFNFRLPLTDEAPKAGDFVCLTTEGDVFLGQVVSSKVQLESSREVSHDVPHPSRSSSSEQRLVARPTVRVVVGEGAILGAEADGYAPQSSPRPFVNATISPARSQEIAAYARGVRAKGGKLAVGRPRGPEDVDEAIGLDPKGLRRHTLPCGQSGSGKTYSLGVILEQLLLHTSLRILVIDPNSDYVRLRAPAHPEVLDAQTREAYLRLSDQIRVFSNNDPGFDRLTIRAVDLDSDSVATLLKLDPLLDREEYSLTAALLEEARQGAAFWESLERGVAQDVPGALALLQRMKNLEIDKWQIWSPGRSCVDALFEDNRCVVLDAGSLERPEERDLIALSALRALWNSRQRREPILIVVDEAHNVSPAAADSRLSKLCTEEVVRIAGEGRKFGLYLLPATQRPSKLHPNVLSQCENLVLMRMNSRADLDYIATMFSQIPVGLLRQASYFNLGEALVAGWVVPNPVFLQFGGRISREGGADVPTTWAESTDP